MGGPWRPPRFSSPCSWLPPCSPSPLLRWLGAVSRPLLAAPPPRPPFSLCLRRQLDPPFLVLATDSKTSRDCWFLSLLASSARMYYFVCHHVCTIYICCNLLILEKFGDAICLLVSDGDFASPHHTETTRANIDNNHFLLHFPL